MAGENTKKMVGHLSFGDQFHFPGDEDKYELMGRSNKSLITYNHTKKTTVRFEKHDKLLEKTIKIIKK
jgi:hypothetical protein